MRRASIAIAFLVLVEACAQAPRAEGLLIQAARIGARARDPQTRAVCLAEVAAAWFGLDADEYRSALESAVAFANAARTDMARAMALRTVALRVGLKDPAAAHSLITDAFQISGDLRDPLQRAIVLRELALLSHRIALDTAGDLTTRALEAAGEVEEPLFRAALFRDLGAGLAGKDATTARAALVKAGEALDAAVAAGPDADLARVDLAAAWALLDIDHGRRAIDGIADPDIRLMAAGMVAQVIAAKSPEAALLLARDVPQGPQRAYITAAGAACMSPEFAETAAAFATAALGSLGDAEGEAADKTRADVSAALAWTSPEGAIDVTDAIKDPERRRRAVATVAQRVGRADPRAALAMLEQVDDLGIAEPVRAQLAAQLAATDPEGAVETAGKLLSRRLRVDSLVQIAERLRAKQENE